MKNARIRIPILLLLGAMCQPILHAGQTTPSTPSVSEMGEVRTSLNILFQAMKEGDVATIEEYSSGPMLSEYKTLFERNQEYPVFLRNFYKGATFSITNVKPTPDGDMFVEVVIQLGEGSKSVTKLNVKRFDGVPVKWKVTEIVKEARPANPHE
jgi:hypothetical protein